MPSDSADPKNPKSDLDVSIIDDHTVYPVPFLTTKPPICTRIDKTSPQDSRLFVKLQVNHIGFTALIDPWSCQSYLAQQQREFLQSIGCVYRTVRTISVKIANGTLEEISESVTVSLRLEGYHFHITFFVLPALTVPALLGMDALTSYFFWNDNQHFGSHLAI